MRPFIAALILLTVPLAGCLQDTDARTDGEPQEALPPAGDAGGDGDGDDPPASEPVPAPAWPRDGSYASYNVTHAAGSPQGVPYDSTESVVNFTFANGSWTATCSGSTTHRRANESLDVHETVLAFERVVSLAPPTGPASVEVGQDVTVPGVSECGYVQHDVRVQGDVTFSVDRDGAPVNASAWFGNRTAECGCQGESATWDRGTGLVLDWSWGGRAGGWAGHLVATDAPVGAA